MSDKEEINDELPDSDNNSINDIDDLEKDNDSEVSSNEETEIIDDDDEFEIDEKNSDLLSNEEQTFNNTNNFTQTNYSNDISDLENTNSENFLEKFNNEFKNDYIQKFHSECLGINFSEIKLLSEIKRDSQNNIIDNLHRTIPILTKFEKTKILGIRVKQLNNGAIPFINIDENILDNYIIANKELEEKKLPFIIQRPLPNNTFEFWKIVDLEII